MDPSSPDFQPAASEAPSRTTCRICGETFVSRNQLMRHLYKTHPKNPGKPKAASQTARPVQPPTLPKPTSSKPVQPQSRIHPFALLSQEQQVDFAGHVVVALFAVGMRQMEEEEERQRQQRQDQQNHDAHESAYSPKKDEESPTADSDTPAAPPPRAGQTHHRKPEDNEESEDSDDEDGGVALFEPRPESLGELVSLGLHDLEKLGEEADLD